MLDECQKDLDVVPDRHPRPHPLPGRDSGDRLGKHVFVQKPLAHNIWPVRTLGKAAKRYGSSRRWATRARLRGHAAHQGVGGRRCDRRRYGGRHLNPSRRGSALVGASRQLSPAHEPRAQRPGLGPVTGAPWPRASLSSLRADPVAPMWDYGCGSLSDIGCHIFDAPFWALDLGAPTKIQAFGDPPPETASSR